METLRLRDVSVPDMVVEPVSGNAGLGMRLRVRASGPTPSFGYLDLEAQIGTVIFPRSPRKSVAEASLALGGDSSFLPRSFSFAFKSPHWP